MKWRLLKRLATVLGGGLLALALASVATVAGCASFGAAPAGPRLQRMEATGRYTEGHFHNEESTTPKSLPGEKSWTSTIDDSLFGNGELRVPTCALPLHPDPSAQLRTPPASGLRITWLGHSTTLVEIDGRTVLTDPMWSERASPFTSVGPRRFHPPPLPLEALPTIDAVVISHDHYDHLDMRTVQRLAERGATFHVGLGLGAHIERWGVSPERIVEHDWWEERSLPGGVRIISTPARHFSGRGLWDSDRTLWTSWTVVGPTHRVFFSGDTGPTSAFEAIADRYGPFDVSMLEIGQWHPTWGLIHLGPRGALEAHQALRARTLLPIHWATFELGLHAWSEPAETLVTESARQGSAVITPLLGEPIEPTTAAQTTAWWRALPPTTAECPSGTQLSVRSLDDWPL